MTLSVVFALAAAFSNAVNLMTQHAASTSAPKREKGWRLVGYLVRQPLWLLGGVAAVGSFSFQALALHHGQLSVVQPILVTELVFVLVLRRVWIRQDVARAAWAAVLVVCVALAVFLIVAEPTGGHPAPETAEWVSAVSVFGGSIAALALLGMRGSPVRRAAVFAIDTLQFVFPRIEQLERPGGIVHLIAQIVRPPAVGVHVVEMLVQVARKQPRNHVEILVVVRREPARVALGLGGRTTLRGKMAGNL